MNIRFVRRRHGGQEVLGELPNASSSELPEINDDIWFDGIQQRVLYITKSYEVDKLAVKLCPDAVSPLHRDCWFEVDIT